MMNILCHRLMIACIYASIGLHAAQLHAAGPEMASGLMKTPPEITLENLSPPFKNHDYFKHHELFPFQYDASSFSLINAWWMAEVSTLVYADEAYVRRQLSKVGLDNVTFIDKSSTQCFVAGNGRFAVVAFRGSEIWKRDENFDLERITADISTDADILLTAWERGGKVHRGFKKALEEVWDELLPLLENITAEGRNIWMTGHSLGGALAILAADRYRNVQGVYTFGSPRVGNSGFRNNFSTPAYRVINGYDLVTHVPPRGFYYHVGDLKVIDATGIIHNQPFHGRDMDENEPWAYQIAELFSENRKKNKRPGPRGFIPAPIRDHVPLLYTIFLWNNLLKQQF